MNAEPWRKLRTGGLVLLGLLVVGGLGYLVSGLFGHSQVQFKTVQSIVKIALPPPPPPPPPPKNEPPKEDKLVEKPKLQEPNKPKELSKAPPKAAPIAPPGNPLTAAAGNGPSAYGLGVGNGGGDTVGGGGGGGGGGYGLYANEVGNALQAALKRDERTRRGHYVVNLKVTLGPTGQVARLTVSSFSGDVSQADLEQAMASAVANPPPPGQPQPIDLRITARPS